MILPAPLVFDAARHRYFLNNTPVPGVTSVLSAAGLLNYDFLPGALREEYLARGQTVHQVTRDDDEGNLAESSVLPEIRSYLTGWRAFKRDYGCAPRLIEHMVFHSRHHYAGRLDRVGSIRGGGMAIIDIKSGTAPDATRFQLAAYAGALDHPRTFRRLCVELHSDGGYRVLGYETRDYQRDFDTFLAALEEFRTKGEI
jgi:hypothetical protein